MHEFQTHHADIKQAPGSASAAGPALGGVLWVGGATVVIYTSVLLLLSVAGNVPKSKFEPSILSGRAIDVNKPIADQLRDLAPANPAAPLRSATFDAPPAPPIQAPVQQTPVPQAPVGRDPAETVAAGSGRPVRDTLVDGKPCPLCPELVVVPSGTFKLGSSIAESWRLDWQRPREEPQVDVTVPRSFAVGRFSVTFDEWNACAADGDCADKPDDSGWGRGKRPVINISWDDAQAYVKWLTRKTGRPYRLLSEVEREYVARAGTTTPFWFGGTPSQKQANYQLQTENGGALPGSINQTLPVDALAPNAWGLHHVHGNVYDWTSDCWTENHAAPKSTGDCSRRVLKGGSWTHPAMLMRSAARTHVSRDFRANSIGFRVARMIGNGG